jgi:hypothetical protein
MNKSKNAGFLTILLASAALFYACKKTDDGTIYRIVNAPMTATQLIPSSGSTAAGAIDGNYDTKTRLLTYKVAWIGLLDSATTLHVHGLADAGALAVAPYTNGIIQTFTKSTSPALPNTKRDSVFTANLYIDGVVLKEEDLLAGKYYIDLHTKAKPNGEIRGQIVLKP